MRVTTLAEARALVGRTFERDGKRRKVLYIDDYWPVITWMDSGTKREFQCNPKTTFSDWLSGATEVTQ